MLFVVLSFVAVFVLVVIIGLMLTSRGAMADRLHEAIDPRPAQHKSLVETIKSARGSMVAPLMENVQSLLPKSESEVSVAVQRLTRAGYREDSAVKVLYASKVLLPVTFCVLALVSGAARLVNPFFLYTGGLGFGFLIPDFWLGRMIKNRQKRLRKGLPDALDLLVICVEAGLSLDQATARTSEELKQAQPDICDELSVVVLEQRAGRPRSEAWKRMADRTDEENIRNLVSMLVQSEQLGTSIAKTLRIHGDTLRQQRVQYVEEQAAKTSVKLVFPLVLFIFPSLFLVTLGPAAIQMAEAFKTLLNH